MHIWYLKKGFKFILENVHLILKKKMYSIKNVWVLLNQQYVFITDWWGKPYNKPGNSLKLDRKTWYWKWYCVILKRTEMIFFMYQLRNDNYIAYCIFWVHSLQVLLSSAGKHHFLEICHLQFAQLGCSLSELLLINSKDIITYLATHICDSICMRYALILLCKLSDAWNALICRVQMVCNTHKGVIDRLIIDRWTSP